jgi:hypothetical protein
MFASSGTSSNARRSIPKGETAPADLARHARALLHALAGEADADAPVAEPTPAPTVTPDVKPLVQRDEEAAPAYKDQAPRASRGSNDWLGYTLLAVAGVSLGLTIFSWAQISSASNDKEYTAYRAAVYAEKPSVKDVCSEADAGHEYGVDPNSLAHARNACSNGKTFESLQYVFLGAALVSAGVGTYFLLDNDGGSEHAKNSGPRLAFNPSVGRDGAAVQLRLDL